jgi:hypothetical protein
MGDHAPRLKTSSTQERSGTRNGIGEKPQIEMSAMTALSVIMYIFFTKYAFSSILGTQKFPLGDQITSAMISWVSMGHA